VQDGNGIDPILDDDLSPGAYLGHQTGEVADCISLREVDRCHVLDDISMDNGVSPNTPRSGGTFPFDSGGATRQTSALEALVASMAMSRHPR
jgi:hypothetical protein